MIEDPTSASCRLHAARIFKRLNDKSRKRRSSLSRYDVILDFNESFEEEKKEDIENR